MALAAGAACDKKATGWKTVIPGWPPLAGAPTTHTTGTVGSGADEARRGLLLAASWKCCARTTT